MGDGRSDDLLKDIRGVRSLTKYVYGPDKISCLGFDLIVTWPSVITTRRLTRRGVI